MFGELFHDSSLNEIFGKKASPTSRGPAMVYGLTKLNAGFNMLSGAAAEMAAVAPRAPAPAMDFTFDFG